MLYIETGSYTIKVSPIINVCYNFFQLYNTADFTEVNHFLPVDIKLISDFDHEKK